MRRSAVTCACLLAIAGGCRHPMQVCTDSRITITGPVTAQVAADLQSTSNVGPVTEMTVAGHAARSAWAKIAIVDVDGLLVNTNLTGPYSASENPVAMFREKLDAVAADPCVCAVIVRINTPGGGVTATDIMWQELRAFRGRTGLPVIACLMDVATGGGYYLATAADMIYAHPTTITGGIGVIFNHYNLQDTMAYFNVTSEPIKAGENIDMGSSAYPMTPETRGLLQAIADQFHRRFEEVVIESRPRVAADDETIFDGRVFTADQAVQRGLVDKTGYVADAIEAAKRLAGQSEARVVMFHRKTDPARSPYAITSNNPAQGQLLPFSVPGLDRSRLPTFLYLWQLEPTLERIGGP